MTNLSHLSTAAIDLGIGLPPTLALVTVVKDKQFDLATHDMYGSSRLGVKSYYPRQVGLGYTQAGGFTDTARLWTRRPWYSLEYQEMINLDSLNLYGNIHKDMYYTQHTRGLKQYELTDHLGDVLATLSDKRATNDYVPASAGPDTIVNYKPVVASAYDYYPFGQYMPGRYTEDTTSYCYTTTLTEMVTVVTQVPIDVHLGHRDVSGTGSPGGPIVEPVIDGTILVHILGADAGTGTGVSWPIGTLGGGGPSEPGDPIGGGGTTPIEGDVLVTAVVNTGGVFNVSVTDDNTGVDIGNVLVSSSNGTVTIKTHYTGVEGHGTSVHVTLDNSAGLDTNIIRVVTITVPHYTSVPVSVVSRVCSEESYRYGYNGKYKDNEWAGKGNHYDYGFRMYDSRICRFISIDPEVAKFPMQSPFAYAKNNPIYYIDQQGRSGRAAKTEEINKATGHPILRITTNIHLYGEGANEKRTAMVKADVEAQYNHGGDYFTYDDGQKVYDVVFDITVTRHELKDLDNDVKSGTIADNYYIVDDVNPDWQVPSKSSYTNMNPNGGNSGVLTKADIDADEHSESHELNHGFGGYGNRNHDDIPSVKPGEVPDISQPRGATNVDGNRIDPKTRAVTQGDINFILNKVNFDKNGIGDVGRDFSSGKNPLVPKPMVPDPTSKQGASPAK